MYKYWSIQYGRKKTYIMFTSFNIPRRSIQQCDRHSGNVGEIVSFRGVAEYTNHDVPVMYGNQLAERFLYTLIREIAQQ